MLQKLFSLLLFSLCFQVVADESRLRMATTTSTENSGLLAVLNPVFEKQHQARVEVIAVGTGKALKLGENGDVDIVFVHAPQAEQAFIDAGFGLNRTAVMHNDFVLLGAKKDIAQVKLATTMVEVLQKIAEQKSEFISRGDDSGTHKKELLLWQQAQRKPQGKWYISAGQGMGAVLKIADEKQAYTLTDRGTYLAYQDKIDLELLFAGDKTLFNPYHIMMVNPERYAGINVALAQKYIDFVTSKQGQTIIANYKKHAQQLFYPDALTVEP